MNGYLSFGHRRDGGLRKSTEGKSGLLVDYGTLSQFVTLASLSSSYLISILYLLDKIRVCKPPGVSRQTFRKAVYSIFKFPWGFTENRCISIRGNLTQTISAVYSFSISRCWSNPVCASCIRMRGGGRLDLSGRSVSLRWPPVQSRSYRIRERGTEQNLIFSARNPSTASLINNLCV